MIDILIQGADALWAHFWELLLNPCETMAIALFEYLFGLMNSSFVHAIFNPILEAVCTIFNFITCIVFLSAIPFYLLKIAQEDKKDWMVIIKCFIMAFSFAALNQHLAKICFYIPYLIVTIFNFAVGVTDFEEYIGSLASGNIFGGSPLVGVCLLIIVLIAAIAFFITSMLRVGAIYIQMFIAPLYLPFVLLGDNQKASEWIFSTVAVGFTYSIQYALFYTGIIIMRYADGISTSVIGLGLILSTFSVPAQMQKFGWSSGAGRGFQSLSMPATSIISTLIRRH
ncbi:MAG: DUF6045 family protein [Angelakisella sp.]